MKIERPSRARRSAQPVDRISGAVLCALGHPHDVATPGFSPEFNGSNFWALGPSGQFRTHQGTKVRQNAYCSRTDNPVRERLERTYA
jgi:hypothetical protein